MNSFLVAFGLASAFLLVGMLLRGKVGFLQKMLVPASVIAGILGLIFMNSMDAIGFNVGTDQEMFTDVVNHLFTISFISICLTDSESEGATPKGLIRGSVGMGTIWCFLYAFTPFLGFLVVKVLGGFVDMEGIYGTLIPFGFAQGPGQAAAFGTLYEGYGWENAKMVALTFASVGFLAAFLIGIPAAKYGIKRGIAKNCAEIDQKILKGYLKKEEQTSYMTKDTTCSSNVETLSFHFALMGLSYLGAIGISKIFEFLPGFLGSAMSGLMFMNGMLAAYIIKFLMKKLKINFLHDNVLQGKITSWTSDYLVICAFMAVGFEVLGKWLIPILVECVLVALVTFFVCFYFGQRIGGSNDFERTLGLFGTSTGTVPSGIALVRIVDPDFKTTTNIELGLMNLVMLLCVPVYIVLSGYAAGSIPELVTMGILLGLSIIYLIILKAGKFWGKKSFSWKGENKEVK